MPRTKGNAKFCPYCGVSFYSGADFKLHIRDRHQPARVSQPAAPGKDATDVATASEIPPLSSGV